MKIYDDINLKDGDFVKCSDGYKQFYGIWAENVGRFAVADNYGRSKRGYYTDIISFEKATPEIKKRPFSREDIKRS